MEPTLRYYMPAPFLKQWAGQGKAATQLLLHPAEGGVPARVGLPAAFGATPFTGLLPAFELSDPAAQAQLAEAVDGAAMAAIHATLHKGLRPGADAVRSIAAFALLQALRSLTFSGAPAARTGFQLQLGNLFLSGLPALWAGATFVFHRPPGTNRFALPDRAASLWVGGEPLFTVDQDTGLFGLDKLVLVCPLTPGWLVEIAFHEGYSEILRYVTNTLTLADYTAFSLQLKRSADRYLVGAGSADVL